MLVETDFEAGGIFVRIIEALDARVQRSELFASPGADGFECWLPINEFASMEYGREQILVLGCRGEMFAAGDVCGINDREAVRNGPSYIVDCITDESSALTEAADLENTRISGFG